jgi:hypothetical protein
MRRHAETFFGECLLDRYKAFIYYSLAYPLSLCTDNAAAKQKKF